MSFLQHAAFTSLVQASARRVRWIAPSCSAPLQDDKRRQRVAAAAAQRTILICGGMQDCGQRVSERWIAIHAHFVFKVLSLQEELDRVREDPCMTHQMCCLAA